MTDISGGSIGFDISFETGKAEQALKTVETLIKNFISATSEGGAKMDAAYQQATDTIREGFEKVDKIMKMNKEDIVELENEYRQLGPLIEAAFMKGDDKQYDQLRLQQQAIRGSINEYKKVNAELHKVDEELVKHNSQLEEEKQKVDKTASANTRFRTQLLNVKNKMMELAEAGREAGLSTSQIQSTPEFKGLVEEANRLSKAMYTANQQIKILTTTKGTTLQGLLVGITGLSGAFTAAQGAIGLFASKNEDLQKIMLRVQSLMSITIGLQQVSQALHQTSAFRVGILTKIQLWWNAAKSKAIGLEAQDTVATNANTASKAVQGAVLATNTTAQKGNTVSLKAQMLASAAGVKANLGLAGSFRAVGYAIKSIPGIGWIIAGITALVGLFSALSSKARKATEEQKEFLKTVTENASKPIASFMKLSAEWDKLGNNLSAKQKFIEENKKRFDELGVSVRGVFDAENLLVKNKQAFIDAQLAKAKAIAVLKTNEDDVAKLLTAEQNLEEAKKKPFVIDVVAYTGAEGGSRSRQVANPDIEKYQKEVDELNKKLKGNINKSIEYEEEAIQDMAKSGIQTTDAAQKESIIQLKKYLADVSSQYDTLNKKQQKSVTDLIALGSLWLQKQELQSRLSNREPELNTEAGIQEEISRLEEYRKTLAITSDEYKWTVKEVEKLNAKLPKKDKKTEDPVKKELEENKKAYKEYFTMVNAGYKQEADRQFAELLKGGNTYMEYLKNRKKQIVGDLQEIGDKMKTTFNGNVDLLARPMIDAAELVKKGWKDVGEGIATVFSSQYGILDKDGKEVEILVTPILPNGSVMSQSELEAYIYSNLQGANDILKADKKGIVISVGVDQDGSSGEVLHKLQEQYYLTNNLSKAQKDILQKLNIAISEETEETVTGKFEKEIQRQLNEVNSLAERLEILKQQREAILPDDPLKEKKVEIITKNSTDIDKQIVDEMRKRLEGYSAYLQEKIDFDLSYGTIKKELELKLEKETNEEKRKIILAQLEQLEKDKEKYNKQTGDKEYDEAIEKYRTFQRKREDIAKEFDELTKKAQEKQNPELIAELEKARAKALSELSLEELKSDDLWKQLFGDLDKLSVNKMIEIRNKIEKIWNELDLDPDALKAIRDEMDKVTDKIQAKNPFKALREAIKQYKKDKEKTGKGDTTDIFKGIAASIDLIKGAFDAVVGGMEKMGIKMDEETQAILDDLGGIMNGASQLSKGIASGDPLQIIQGSVDLLSSAFDLFNSRDRDAEKSIKRHEKAINDLQRAYNQLSWAIDKALGNDVYKNQQAAIANMIKQREHLQKMWEAEASKKNPDSGRISDFKEQYAELGRQIEDMLDEIRSDLIQTDAKSFAGELGDALVEAFNKGESAAKSFGDTVDNLIRNIVLNQIKKNMIEKQLEPLLDDLERQMGYWETSGDRKSEIDKINRLTTKLQSDIKSTEAWLDRNKNLGGINNISNMMIVAQQSSLKKMKEQLAAYQSDLSALMEGGDKFVFTGITDAAAGVFKNEIEKMSEDAMKVYEEYAKALGWTGETDTSLTGAIKGVTEETASIVAGQLNAMRINQSEANEVLRQQLAYLLTIAQNTSYNRYLQSIDARLGRIENSDVLRSQGMGI
ncbi:MAG: hypothetical protein LBJ63_07830 [Prevotellaceae bacterium]|jgi:chromosome segregation ATPase|nr:hypothetical protein [Prevotellaceae bacterium]